MMGRFVFLLFEREILIVKQEIKKRQPGGCLFDL